MMTLSSQMTDRDGLSTFRATFGHQGTENREPLLTAQLLSFQKATIPTLLPLAHSNLLNRKRSVRRPR